MTTYPTLQKPNRGEAVKTLQRLLHLTADGIFGDITREAVLAFQRANGLTADGIVGPKTWAKLLSQPGVTTLGEPAADGSIDPERLTITSRRTINELIIHCSATPEGRDYTVADITKWHKQRGFATIGYHYVVYRNGKIFAGRDINTIGAHCTGHNSYSIGICYIGGCETDGKTAKDTRTPEQRKSLYLLLKRLQKLYPKAKVVGHRELSKDQNGDGIISPWEFEKDCPSFECSELRTSLRTGKY